MKKSGHFSVAVKQESVFSTKMGSHNSQPLDESISFFEKVSYSGYCHVHSDGRSMTALGGKIPDISYIVVKLTMFCLGRSPQMIQCCERNEH